MVQEGELALKSDLEILPREADTIEVDSLTHTYGIVMTKPESPSQPPLRQGEGEGISFILGALFLLFLIISLRFRNNIKYALTIFRNLVETRTRQNIFDDTVREASMIIMLNVLWCFCVGIIGFSFLEYYRGEKFTELPQWLGMVSVMGVAGVYALFMFGAYAGVGWVFSDRSHSELWVKGYSASQAMMAPAFFITALIAISRPGWILGVSITSAIVFIIVKMIFIWKGYRIFFNQFSSWVLFLCYLCSLEIVPLIISCRLASFLDESLR
ncbi:MAG: DUF4271 domain-containing protein [Muribaculaceae bacterium]|nr:DUF4271 domain-containing protein [Muribaculaceae bacterium]